MLFTFNQSFSDDFDECKVCKHGMEWVQPTETCFYTKYIL